MSSQQHYSKQTTKKKSGQLELEVSDDSQEEESWSESEESEEEPESDSDKDDPDKQLFLRKQPNNIELNEDGTAKFVPQSKLMLKIAEISGAAGDDEDDLENSFDEENDFEDTSEEDEEEGDESSVNKSNANKSHANLHAVAGDDDQDDNEGEDGEGEDNGYGDEEDEYGEEVKHKKKTVQEKDDEEEEEEDKPPPKKKKYRKNVVNVYCTEYDIVPKVAKKVFNCRLRYYDEDHDGGINENGDTHLKLQQDWDMSWHDLSISPDFLAKMSSFQKVNQYPGIYVLSRKNNLARNLLKMQRSYPNDYDFFPRTWILPQESTDFRNQFVDKDGKALKKKKTFIIKPDGLSQGQGIYLSRNCERIIRQCTEDGGYIVQQYLDKPHLIDDLKYDLRIYVLVYGMNPLRIYLHEQGIARFATEPYIAPKASNINNLYMHLTNYAINKNNSAFMQNNGGGNNYGSEDDDMESDEESGHKRSLHAILKILMQQGADPDAIMDKIKDIIVKTVIVGQPYMSHIYRSCQPDDYDNSMCYQILGFDIMIDKYFRPWLIEINQSPSFATDSALDYEVKKNVLGDAFKLVNISQPKRCEIQLQKQKEMAERILTGKQQKMDPVKKKELMEKRLAERFEYENNQIRCGGGNNYELIFPSPYHQEQNKKYEMLLSKANDNWDEFTTGAKGKKKAAEMEQENIKKEQDAKKQMRIKKKKQLERKMAMKANVLKLQEHKNQLEVLQNAVLQEEAISHQESSFKNKQINFERLDDNLLKTLDSSIKQIKVDHIKKDVRASRKKLDIIQHNLEQQNNELTNDILESIQQQNIDQDISQINDRVSRNKQSSHLQTSEDIAHGQSNNSKLIQFYYPDNQITHQQKQFQGQKLQQSNSQSKKKIAPNVLKQIPNEAAYSFEKQNFDQQQMVQKMVSNENSNMHQIPICQAKAMNNTHQIKQNHIIPVKSEQRTYDRENNQHQRARSGINSQIGRDKDRERKSIQPYGPTLPLDQFSQRHSRLTNTEKRKYNYQNMNNQHLNNVNHIEINYQKFNELRNYTNPTPQQSQPQTTSNKNSQGQMYHSQSYQNKQPEEVQSGQILAHHLQKQKVQQSLLTGPKVGQQINQNLIDKQQPKLQHNHPTPQKVSSQNMVHWTPQTQKHKTGKFPSLVQQQTMLGMSGLNQQPQMMVNHMQAMGITEQQYSQTIKNQPRCPVSFLGNRQKINEIPSKSSLNQNNRMLRNSNGFQIEKQSQKSLYNQQQNMFNNVGQQPLNFKFQKTNGQNQELAIEQEMMANHKNRVDSNARGTIMMNTKNLNKPQFLSQQGLPNKVELFIDNIQNIQHHVAFHNAMHSMENKQKLHKNITKGVQISNGKVRDQNIMRLAENNGYAQQMIPNSNNYRQQLPQQEYNGTIENLGPQFNQTAYNQQQRIGQKIQQHINYNDSRARVKIRGQFNNTNQSNQNVIGNTQNLQGHPSRAKNTPKNSQKESELNHINVQKKISGHTYNGGSRVSLDKQMHQKQSNSQQYQQPIEFNNKSKKVQNNPEKTLFFVPNGSNFNPNRRTNVGRI